MLTVGELRGLVESGEVDTIDVAFPDLYGRLVGKRFDAEFFLDDALESGTHACDYLLTVDMDMNPVEGYASASWEQGYGDLHLVPDMASLRRLSWRDRTAFVLCDVLDPKSHQPLAGAPRTVLRRQIEHAADIGLRALGASELEFYTFEESNREAADGGWAHLTPGSRNIQDYHLLQTAREEPLLGALRRHLRDSGIPVENSKGEWGRGQHELNIRYTELLEMADRHMVYKQCVKEVADSQGCSATFMAKPYVDAAGSSCHVHISLWDGDQNVFAGDQDFEGIACSDTFRWFLGGWIAHTRELMVLIAPTVNSYKRYVSGSWAPTGLAWSYDNRTAGFRVVGAGPSLRIECRIPGADCNPYLVFAAALAAGMDGIAQHTEPPPMFRGDAYSPGAAHAQPAALPRRLGEAVDLFEASAFARESFGSEMIDHYTHFFRTEERAYEQAVTDWERRRYFEQI